MCLFFTRGLQHIFVVNLEKLLVRLTNQVARSIIKRAVLRMAGAPILDIVPLVLRGGDLIVPVVSSIQLKVHQNLTRGKGRRRGGEYFYKHKPDLIVGEWMCSPFSKMKDINMAKTPELCDQILRG